MGNVSKWQQVYEENGIFIIKKKTVDSAGKWIFQDIIVEEYQLYDQNRCVRKNVNNPLQQASNSSKSVK